MTGETERNENMSIREMAQKKCNEEWNSKKTEEIEAISKINDEREEEKRSYDGSPSV